jgi:DNA primase
VGERRAAALPVLAARSHERLREPPRRSRRPAAQRSRAGGCVRAVATEPHTPYNPDQLVAHLRKRGFADDELVDTGLARRRDGEALSDSFQQRVLVPVRDERGAVIGLIGRSTVGSERRMAAKYLNPARTAVYDKSTALYAPVDVALAKDGQVVIVEGALDALAIAAAARHAGLADRFLPVCTSGLSFSDSQIERILAMHPRAPVIALDGDAAGQQAAARLAARIAQHGREAAIVTWPRGEDPASWLEQHGPNGLTAVTRRGCLEAGETELRPRHAAPEAATVLMESGDSLETKVAAALSPAGRMTPTVAERYSTHAAESIAPVVVAAAASVSTDDRGRVNQVVETVASYGTKFPTDAQKRYVELAVREIEMRELAPGAWAERQISARLDQTDGPLPPPAVSGAVVAPVQAAGTS